MKETKELLSFVIEFIEAVLKSLDDGKINVSDIMNFKNVLPKIGPAISGAEKIREELMCLNATEIRELCDFFKDEFDIENDNMEMIIESLIELAVSFFGTASMIKKAKKCK